MGIARDTVVACLLVGAAALGGAPWWAGVLALVMAAWPWRIGPTLGAAALLGGVPWPVGLGVLLIPTSGEQRPLAVALALLTLALVLRQVILYETLPVEPVMVLGALAAATGAVASAWVVGGSRVQRVGLALGGLVLLARLGLVFAAEGGERLTRALEVHAERIVYASLVNGAVAQGDRELAEALVRAVPDRDEAALRLGWRAALDAGWRPQRAEGFVIEVAQALEQAGRGGEALRLLARHPREGEVDAWRTLLERTQGVPARWGGARLGETLAGDLPLSLHLDKNGYVEVLFTTSGAGEVALVGEGVAWEGAPSVRVRLDAGEEARWEMDGTVSRVLGAVEPGPHRVQVWFDTDRVGPGGDRQVRLTALTLR